LCFAYKLFFVKSIPWPLDIHGSKLNFYIFIIISFSHNIVPKNIVCDVGLNLPPHDLRGAKAKSCQFGLKSKSEKMIKNFSEKSQKVMIKIMSIDLVIATFCFGRGIVKNVTIS